MSRADTSSILARALEITTRARHLLEQAGPAPDRDDYTDPDEWRQADADWTHQRSELTHTAARAEGLASALSMLDDSPIPHADCAGFLHWAADNRDALRGLYVVE
jgi:hypothetical protein